MALIEPARTRADLAATIRESYNVRESESVRRPTPTGISAIDSLTGGLPEGAISEVFGPQSSGRTSVMLSTLAAFSHTDLCALIDTQDAFDVKTAAKAGATLENVLWAKCGGNLQNTLAVTEQVLRSGLFSFVVLDLAGMPERDTRRIQQGHWLRFRRAIENTAIVFLVIGKRSFAQSLAGLVVELRQNAPTFRLTNGQQSQRTPFGGLLHGLNSSATQRRPFALKPPAQFCASVPSGDQLKKPQ